MNGICGCCDPPAPSTPLTINNRPGLSAVAYRIGTYASFREAMLEEIARIPELSGLGTRRDDDPAITLLDLWAAVSDVLTFYQERYANEVFFRTAQQPQSLRRLAGLLGYNPRPGTAALANLAFNADLGKVIQVQPGLRVQSTPSQDQLPATYETIENATVDWRFNRLRIYPLPLPENPLSAGRSEATLSRRQGPQLGAGIATNDQVVIFNDRGADPVEEKKVKQTRIEDDRVIVSWTRAVQASTWNNSTSAVKFRRKLQLFGFSLPTDFYHPVSSSAVPGGILWRSDPIDFSLVSSSTYNLDARYSDLGPGTFLLFVMPQGGGGLSTIARTVTGVTQASNHLGPLSDTVTRVTLDGAIPPCPDLRNAAIYELTGDFLSFADTGYELTMGTDVVYMPGIVREDATGIGVEVGRTVLQDQFVPGVVIHPKDLEAGRKLILTDGKNNSVQATLRSIPSIEPAGAPVGSFVHLALTLDAATAALQTSSAALLGNVVAASHGETVRNEVVGSGDASQTFQRFALQRPPLTYVRGSGPNGVVTSLNVRVNGLLWKEVTGLYEQPAGAQVYSTSLSEEGRTVVQFGDSDVGGAVLPTGTGNVTATYRTGAGVAGRVGANALATLLDRLQGLTSVNNPLSGEGGADPESLEMIRQNAPRTVRTFERAVSLQDYEDLITASGEVAKAQALWIRNGLSPVIYLTVAGQSGGTFSDPSALAIHLDQSRDTTRRLLVGNFARVPVQISVKVVVSPQFVPDVVVQAVRVALLQALSFEVLKLGQSLHLSRMYGMLQAVPGVVALDLTKFGFVRPAGLSDAEFDIYLDSRGVERLSDGSVALVQEHLRILSARLSGAVPGEILPAELAFIENPAQDVLVSVEGS